MFKKYSFLLVTPVLIFAATTTNPSTVERTNYTYDEFNTTSSGKTTNLKYFQYYDMMPDEISMPIFENMNMSSYSDKRLIVGYGMVDPAGKNCKVFLKQDTGFANDIKICLPWWRIERVYQKEQLTLQKLVSYFQSMPRPREPKLVNYCKNWQSSATYSGGIVTCTTYYDRFKSPECYDNPMQNACKVNNCGMYLEKECQLERVVTPDDSANKLWGANYQQGGVEPVTKVDAKVGLQTKQYSCPSGKIIPYTSCLEEQTALMYPYECKSDDPSTPRDDGEYKYCDSNSPTYDSSGNIVGFLGKCSDGRSVVCDVDTIAETKKVCTAPVYKTSTEDTAKSIQVTRQYKEKNIDIYSGQPDIYANDPSCVRANTVEEARDGVYTAKIQGSGNLDDDIYVLRHRPDGTHLKVYCNMQHAGSFGSKKLYNGENMQCIANNGSYSFDDTISIAASDIVSVQQATEDENSYHLQYLFARTHYRSSEVQIAGIVVTPATYTASFPKYPSYGGAFLQLWDNSLGSLGLMFPFAGAYEMYFYNNTNEEVAVAKLDITDFQSMGNGYIPLKLAEKVSFDQKGLVTTPCFDDPLVEWGGGVHGGKSNLRNESCSVPNDAFVKSKAVYKVVIKDLLTGQVTPIPLVYPLAYPNRVFASKLKIMEHRKYRCYDPFQLPAPPSN